MAAPWLARPRGLTPTERTRANRWAWRASCGSTSVSSRPGAVVCRGLNSPPISAGGGRVGRGGGLGRHLGERRAGGGGVQGLDPPADPGGGVGLGVPQVDVAGRALEVEEDAAVGLAEAVGPGGGAGGCGEEVGQR